MFKKYFSVGFLFLIISIASISSKSRESFDQVKSITLRPDGMYDMICTDNSSDVLTLDLINQDGACRGGLTARDRYDHGYDDTHFDSYQCPFQVVSQTYFNRKSYNSKLVFSDFCQSESISSNCVSRYQCTFVFPNETYELTDVDSRRVQLKELSTGRTSVYRKAGSSYGY